jgi:hypothetical protein
MAGGIRWNEHEVFGRLRHVFPSPAYVSIPQVRNGAGYARRQTRTCDALVASVYPSRGLYLTGFEIKVSRSDWKKELAHAEKSVELQRFCKYWYVAAPVGVVPVAELPETWGLVEVQASTASIVKPAPVLEWQQPDLLFVCSVLRSAVECTVPTGTVDARVSEAIAKATASAEENRDWRQRELREAVEAFEKASGIKIGSRWDAGDIGKAVAFVIDTGLLRATEVARDLRNRAAAIVEKLDGALVKLEG